MATYSNYFSFGSGPSIKTGVKNNVDLGLGGSRWTTGTTGNISYDYVSAGQQDEAAAKAFDAIMAGHDAASQAYIDKLTSIYDGYQTYAKEFGDKAQPIIDALTGDIGDMQGYIKKYGDALDESRSTLMDGINIDPSATRTREEYQGNVAANYGRQREQLNQQMASQGINPFANKGATRDLALSEAAAQTGAANTAYKDWRNQYNDDIKAKQQGQAMYANLLGKQGDLQGQVITARRGVIDANKDVMTAKIGADQARASGLTDLLSLQENRRQEALKLGQQQQENARADADIMQQLGAKLTNRDKWAASL